MKRTLTSFADVEQALQPYIPLVKELTGRDTVLDRILPLMDYLGNPQDKLRTIHLAGTSGKTSTAYYVAALLKEANKKVGLTVSPHIDKINERTQINSQPLSEEVYCREISEFIDKVESSGMLKPSYFEIIYAFSIWVFAKYQVDYAVIETGVGGLHDATNVVSREDKICVLTDIGYDHMALLGDSIDKITAQKVGIVHNHNPLLMYKQDAEVMQVVEQWVNAHSAKLLLTNEETEVAKYGHGNSFDGLAEYQKRNWLLAYFVYRYCAERDHLDNLDETKLSITQQIKIPARMDAVTIDNKLLVMDGAHNYQKMLAFTTSYKKLYPGYKPAMLVGFKSDKYIDQVLPLIYDLASEIIVTSFKTSQELPVTSARPEDIAEGLIRLGPKSIKVEADEVKAYNLLLKSTTKQLVITGSFYLIAQLRQDVIND